MRLYRLCMNQRYLFFDLDGTLIDPKIGITTCLQYALKKLDVPVPDADELLWCIGPPLYRSFAELLHTTDESMINAGVRFYRERFSAVGKFESSLYQAIPATLRRLKSEGFQLFIATSKAHVYAEEILRHFEIAAYFTKVYGSELDGRLTEKADLLAHALNTEQLAPEDCWMIGDRKHDVIGANANQMECIGVLYGYGSREELVNAGARHLAATPDELCEIVYSS